MALQIRRTSSVKVRLITTLMMAFALVAQPFYGLVSSQVASAAAVSASVQIIGVMPNPAVGDSEYVTLKNISDGTVDLDQWKIHDGDNDSTISTTSSLVAGATVTICDGVSSVASCDASYTLSHTFTFTDTGDTITLKNSVPETIDTATYTSSEDGVEVTFAIDTNTSPSAELAVNIPATVTVDTPTEFSVQLDNIANATGVNARIEMALTQGNPSAILIEEKNTDGTYSPMPRGSEEVFSLASTGTKDYRVTFEDTVTYKAVVTLLNNANDKMIAELPVSINVIESAVITAPINESPKTTLTVPTEIVGNEFTVSGVATDDNALNRVYVQLVNRDNSKRYGGTTINLIGKGTEADWSKTYNANELNLPDGDYAAHVSVVDMTGKTGSKGWSTDFTVDSTAPVIESATLENINNDDVTSAAMNTDGKLKLTMVTDEEILDWKSQAFLMRTTADGGAIALSRVHFDKISDNTYVAHLSVDEGVLADAYTEDMRLRFKLYDVLTNSTPWTYLTLNTAGEYDAEASVYRFTVDNDAPDASALLGESTIYMQPGRINRQWENSTSGDVVKYIYKSFTSEARANHPNGPGWDKELTANGSDVYTVSGTTDHTFWWRVAAVDAAGNMTWSEIHSVVVDKDAPVADITSHEDGEDVSGIVDLVGEVSDVNPMNTYFRITGPGYGDTSLFKDGRSVHEFVWDTTHLPNGAYTVQFETRDQAGNKTSVSTEKITLNVNNPQPTVLSQNFNTHSGVDYKGINVGFEIANFADVTEVSVALYRDGETTPFVTNTDNQNLLDLIASGITQLSTPFIITDGMYIEEYWNLGEYEWTTADIPAMARVSVTGINNVGDIVTETVDLTVMTEPNGWTFASLVPAVDDEDDSTTETQRNETQRNARSQSGIISTLTQPIFASTANNGLAFSGSDVLGAQDDEDENTEEDDAEVLGTQDNGTPLANTGAIETGNDIFKIFGLAWFWWLAIASVAVAGWLWLAAAIRRYRGTEI
ncbi:MAG TPA: lamin tail domain-containing protein [Candidatus Saccharimonadales bacterium]|nr:lamin tail domain-containing protein [Candidatus Saccharimonadales bacterium]